MHSFGLSIARALSLIGINCPTHRYKEKDGGLATKQFKKHLLGKEKIIKFEKSLANPPYKELSALS
jgi:hypothetical protein